jgi:hypothetical protein
MGGFPAQLVDASRSPESSGASTEFLVDADTITPSEEESPWVIIRAFERTLDRLAFLGLDVFITGSVSEPGFDVSLTVAVLRYAGIFDRIVAKRPGVRPIPIWDRFCAE